MYLYKRRKKWWVEYTVAGVRHRFSTHASKLADAKFFAQSIDAAKCAPTLEDAMAILKTIWRERPTPSLPLAEAWENYGRIAKTVGKLSVTDKTLKDRRNRVSAFVRWAKQNAATVANVGDVTGQIAILYAQHLAAEKLKTKTRKNIITDLSTVWKILEKSSPSVRNPWENLALQDSDGECGEPFTREQEAAVMAAAEKIGKDWPAVCAIARHTGLRYGDIAMLEWKEIVGNVIRTIPVKTKRHKIAVTLPIAKPLAAVLKKLPRQGDYVFPLHALMYDQNGGKDIMKFREVLDAAGIKGSAYTFHSWRHTFRTRLAEAGVANDTAMRLCGHTQLKTSLRYDHDEHLAESRRAIEAAAQ